MEKKNVGSAETNLLEGQYNFFLFDGSLTVQCRILDMSPRTMGAGVYIEILSTGDRPGV